tara:strand:- start:141 stop:521 length:381 start_codon:yes stop_codon:yes gene_type:complete
MGGIFTSTESRQEDARQAQLAKWEEENQASLQDFDEQRATELDKDIQVPHNWDIKLRTQHYFQGPMPTMKARGNSLIRKLGLESQMENEITDAQPKRRVFSGAGIPESGREPQPRRTTGTARKFRW